MPNGKIGDDPILDIVHWKKRRFSEKADHLVEEIVNLGGKSELVRAFNLFSPPPLQQFEASLQEIRDCLYAQAKERGWEV